MYISKSLLLSSFILALCVPPAHGQKATTEENNPFLLDLNSGMVVDETAKLGRLNDVILGTDGGAFLDSVKDFKSTHVFKCKTSVYEISTITHYVDLKDYVPKVLSISANGKNTTDDIIEKINQEISDMDIFGPVAIRCERRHDRDLFNLSLFMGYIPEKSHHYSFRNFEFDLSLKDVE